MAEPELESIDKTTPVSSRVSAVVTDDVPQGREEAGTNTNDPHNDPVVMNMELMQEIKILHQRLLGLERVARPKLDSGTLAAEWKRTRGELGLDEEKKRWEEEKQRRQQGLIAANILHAGGMHDTVYDEELAYNAKLFEIRKNWEQRLVLYSGSECSETDSDTDSDSDSIDGPEFYYARRSILKRAYQVEAESLRHERDSQRWHIQLKERKKRALERKRGYEERVKQDNTEEKVDDASPEVAADTTEGVIDPDARSELTRAPWAHFKSLLGLKGDLSAAIDVLIGEPIIEYDFSHYKRWSPAHNRKAKTTQTQEKRSGPKLDSTPEGGLMPERIRINSRYLLRILSGLQGIAGELYGTPIILLRPFRILAYYNHVIRDRCNKLEKRLENRLKNRHSDGDTSNSTSEPALESVGVGGTIKDVSEEGPIDFNLLPKGEVGKENRVQEEEEETKDGFEGLDDTKTAVAIEHLKCLIGFMDNDMQNRISHLESNRCQKVAFSDLWYLFQPGDLVIGNDGKQAYRILSMRSVEHKVIDPWSRWYARSEVKEEEALIAIKCVYIDFDGKRLGPVSKTFRIPRFEREKAVTSLEIYPLRFHPFRKDNIAVTPAAADGTADTIQGFKKYLIERGGMFLKVAAIRLTAIQPMYYAGPALQTQDEIESQVVVDFEAALGIEEHIEKHWKPELETLIGSENSDEISSQQKACNASCCVDEAVHDDSYVEGVRNKEFMGQLLPKTREGMPSVVILPRPLDSNLEAELTDDDLAIMSYRVFGFVLRNRKWAQLDLTHLSEAQPSGTRYEGDGTSGEQPKTAFDQLVLPDQHKDMILSLVTQHFRSKELSHNDQAADIVRGKGKGLILLLHGAPGVGKTTTAEGVAEIFKKPLFQLTCGDLGTTAKDVESALETNFALANRWGCVLLLDEADVFLAQRTKEDFQRNGLVAVFLRVLEYYAGILFLTTNRVGDFDEAFASRIHISLYYPELGREETLKVFELNLQLIEDRFKDKPRKFVPDRMRIGAFAQEYWDKHPFDHWNGRQIRNACQTALALAEYEAQGKNHLITLNPNAEVRLNRSHFETVGEAYLAFSKHLKDIYGTHAARRAQEAGLRAMWVNEKGEIMGNIGPKEAKAMKKSRFMAKARGHHTTESFGQQQQFAFSGRNPQYGGGQGGMQGGWEQQYNNPPPQGPYGGTPMPQQYASPQQQRGMMGTRPPPGQEWGGPGSSYEHGQQQFEAGGRESYQQQNVTRSTHYLQPPRGHSPQPQQTGQLPPGGVHHEFGAEDDMSRT
ncbi:hypothetical protein F5Y04DRAFT_243037 [Hypomontagnella monticulosa]|nr:hypothetical protein F5Y04DRAFT_243037 [Hypomontagnella monticulosa]